HVGGLLSHQLFQKDVTGHRNATVIGCQAREREGTQRHSRSLRPLVTRVSTRTLPPSFGNPSKAAIIESTEYDRPEGVYSQSERHECRSVEFGASVMHHRTVKPCRRRYNGCRLTALGK